MGDVLTALGAVCCVMSAGLAACLSDGAGPEAPSPPTCAAPCENGGSCVAGACVCAAGYSGAACTTRTRTLPPGGEIWAEIEFENPFCAAKFDCCWDNDDDGRCASDGSEDIQLLKGADGERGPTMILGFTCTGDTRHVAALDLYFDEVTLDCSGDGAADITLRGWSAEEQPCGLGDDGMSTCSVVTEAGGADADAVLFQAAYYLGSESVGEHIEKLYWNLAFGVRHPAIAGCVLRARATLDDASRADGVRLGTIAAGVVHPYVQWEVPLGSCGEEPLTFDDPMAPVRVVFTGENDGPLSFAYGFGTHRAAGPFCDPPCVGGAQCIEAACVCPAGAGGEGCEAGAAAPVP